MNILDWKKMYILDKKNSTFEMYINLKPQTKSPTESIDPWIYPSLPGPANATPGRLGKLAIAQRLVPWVQNTWGIVTSKMGSLIRNQ